MHAASLTTQRKWTPDNFLIDDEYGCLTAAHELSDEVPQLSFRVGRTRFKGDKWGDHAWNVTPRGAIVDPYYQDKFPDRWHEIEYVEDTTVFDGVYA